MYRWTRWCVVLLAVGLLADLASAQSRAFSKQLSSGIHAVRQGRYVDAVSHLDTASDINPNDPRVYYFRGIAKDRMGQLDEAETDYQLGAQMEVVYGKQDVGRYLQRIQGGDRARLEQYRRDARQIPIETLAKLREEADAQRAARQQAVAATEPPPQETQPTPDAAAFATLPADDTDPFAQVTDGELLGRGTISAAEALVADDGLGGGFDDVAGDGFDAGDFVANDSSDTGGADDGGFDDGSFEAGGGFDDFAADDSGSGDDFAASDEGFDDFDSGDDFAGDEAMGDAPQPKKSGGGGGGGILGAALRAFGRSVTPDVELPIPGAGPGGPIPPGPGPGFGPPGAVEQGGDDFGPGGFDDEDFGAGDDFGGDFGAEDDFGDFGDESTEGNPFGDDPK